MKIIATRCVLFFLLKETSVTDCTLPPPSSNGPSGLTLMMIDYNVSDHWPENEPAWVKSLVSSLDRNHGASTVLPLTVVIEEIVNWVELASGSDAWRKAANRDSLRQDLEESVDALGGTLRAEIDIPLGLFQAAFTRLNGSPAAVLNQPLGTRTDAAWAELIATAEGLLSSLDSSAAVGASWDDLTATAQNRALQGREYRPIAELLFDQLRRRGLSADQTFRQLVSTMAFGLSPEDRRIDRKVVSLEERTANARVIACTPAKVEPIVVWLGYQGRVSWASERWAGHLYGCALGSAECEGGGSGIRAQG